MEKLKIGIMGVQRGSAFARCLTFMQGVELTAVCEIDSSVMNQIEPYMGKNTIVYKDFDEFIHSGIDGVILCNYFHEHAPFAIKAFQAGVAVLSETTAAISLGECVDLVEACEEYKGRYMLAANCPYFKAVHAMKQRIESGVTGKVMYGEAEYLHAMSLADGVQAIDYDNLHWRQCMPTNYYNMHTLGPLMYVANSEPVKVSAKAICNQNLAEKGGHVVDSVGAVVLTEMDNGALFNTTGCNGYNPTSKWYRIACENETMETERYDFREEKLIVAKDAAYKEVSIPSMEESGLITKDDNINTYDVAASGHGGIDYFITYHFIQYLRGKEEPFFDVYRSVRLSAAGILSWYSILSDGKGFAIPDFRVKEEREAVRNDYRTPIAKKYSDLQIPCRVAEKNKFKY